MHELAIAHALMALVLSRVSPGDEVSDVEIEVGALTGIIPESLAFHFDGLALGTPLEGARLVCRPRPPRILCPSCETVYEPTGFGRVCTACGALGGTVLSGQELNLVSVGRHRHVRHVRL